MKELRKKRNLSQKEVADRLDLHVNTIRSYEGNTLTPSVESLVALAVLYNSSVDYILGLSNRTHLFIDDCSPEKQKAILEIVESLKRNIPD